MMFGCNHVFYQPSRQMFTDPERLKLKDLNWTEHYFSSQDGTKLHSWRLQTKEEKVKGLIILFHGNAENLSTHFLSLAWIIPHGYDLFIFDYRGYGKSEGVANRKGIYEDSLAALDEAYKIKEERKAQKFIVYGQSLGGIVSLRGIFDSPHYNKINLVVTESSFSSYQEIAFDRVWSSWLIFWLSPLAYLAVSDDYSIKKYLPKLTRPLLVIHGTEDPVIPFKFGEEIYRLSNKESPKWIWVIEGGRHIDAFWAFGDKRYQQKFLHFLAVELSF